MKSDSIGIRTLATLLAVIALLTAATSTLTACSGENQVEQQEETQKEQDIPKIDLPTKTYEEIIADGVTTKDIQQELDLIIYTRLNVGMAEPQTEMSFKSVGDFINYGQPCCEEIYKRSTLNTNRQKFPYLPTDDLDKEIQFDCYVVSIHYSYYYSLPGGKHFISGEDMYIVFPSASFETIAEIFGQTRKSDSNSNFREYYQFYFKTEDIDKLTDEDKETLYKCIYEAYELMKSTSIDDIINYSSEETSAS